LFIEHEHVEDILSDHRVSAVKFIGSTFAGKKVAEVAGRYVKRGAFELGGADPFIILDDADMDLVVHKAIIGRLANNGQSCINSKRFIVHEKHYDEFKKILIAKLSE
jgi:succinate-semialdehyde dehydrogenase / glutarate-semialdehyde dehydrogenase